jgi:glutamate-1-semialdehyde 2,1-aminomutase
VQERTDVTPDLTAMGKIIGGGLPVGAFGGKSEIMDHLAPLGPVYQAGTLSGNPLALAAGIASLRLLRETMPYDYLDNLGSTLSTGIKEIANEYSIPLQVPQVGSMYCLFFSEEPISNFEDALASDGESFKKLFKYCLDHGIYLPPSAYETCFISTAHQMGDIEKTLETIKRSFATF